MQSDFDHHWLARHLARLRPAPERGRLLVACSGGLDSSVLLAACAASGEDALHAVYVDHGLHPDAARWGDTAKRLCQRVGVPLQRLTITPGQGGNLEARARAARYAALARELAPDDVLLTAHHADDQLETVLLQLLRGAGPAGLAAMPDARRLGAGWHLRPLLPVPRAALRAYATAHEIAYADDPSNLDARFERNFLRRDIVPALKARWPGVLATAARSAQLCADAQALCADLAQLDGVDVAAPGPLWLGPAGRLPARRLGNAIRVWLRQRQVRPPNRARLDEFVRQLQAAGGDRQPALRWETHGLRRYRDWLYLLPARTAPPTDYHASLAWGETLTLPAALGALALDAEPAVATPPLALAVSFRRGGEVLAAHADGHRVPVKALFQQHGVLPWRRASVPLLWAGERLVAVGDLWHDLTWWRLRPGQPSPVLWRGRPTLRAPDASPVPGSRPPR